MVTAAAARAALNQGCYFTLANGSFGATANVSQVGCQNECQTNANANPGDMLTCYYNGQLVPVTASNSSNVGCKFTLSQGGSGATAGQSLAQCQQECRTNANNNPQDAHLHL